MKAAQDRQINYEDLKKRSFDMNPGDLVMFKISPRKGLIMVGHCHTSFLSGRDHNAIPNSPRRRVYWPLTF